MHTWRVTGGGVIDFRGIRTFGSGALVHYLLGQVAFCVLHGWKVIRCRLDNAAFGGKCMYRVFGLVVCRENRFLSNCFI